MVLSAFDIFIFTPFVVSIVQEREAKETLEQLRKEIAESLEPLKQQEENLTHDLEQLYQRRRELQQELNRVNDDIRSKAKEKKTVSEKAEALGEKFREKKEVLNSRYNGMIARCEEAGVGTTLRGSIQGIVEDVDKVIEEMDVIGVQKPASMDKDKRRYYWAEQTFLSCQSDKLIIDALKQRLEKSQGEYIKLKNEADNFKGLNMKNVVKEVEKSLVRVSAEIQEDQNSIATLTQQTRDYVRDFLHQYSILEDRSSEGEQSSLIDKELAFVRKICDMALDLGLDQDFISSLALPEPSQSALDFVDQHFSRDRCNIHPKTPVNSGHAETAKPSPKAANAQATTPQPNKKIPPRPNNKATSNDTLHRSSSSWGSSSGGNRTPVSLKDLRKQANHRDNVSET